MNATSEDMINKEGDNMTEQDCEENNINDENVYLRKSSLHIKGIKMHSLSQRSE